MVCPSLVLCHELLIGLAGDIVALLADVLQHCCIRLGSLIVAMPGGRLFPLPRAMQHLVHLALEVSEGGQPEVLLLGQLEPDMQVHPQLLVVGLLGHHVVHYAPVPCLKLLQCRSRCQRALGVGEEEAEPLQPKTIFCLHF